MTKEQLFIIIKAIFYANPNLQMDDNLVMQFIEYAKIKYEQYQEKNND